MNTAPTYSERLLDLLANALEGSFLRTGSNECFIREAMGLVRTHDLIERHSRNGQMKVVESGRDCDGVEYDGLMRICDASLEAFEKLHDHISGWADGPFQLTIVSWDIDIEYTSRDLVMEAHENGHRHSIVSRFP